MKRRTFPWLLVILWMVLIFYLSHQPASRSNALSKEITEKIIVVVEKGTSNVDINIRRFNHILRKNAHFFAYLVLGILGYIGLAKKSYLDGDIDLISYGLDFPYEVETRYKELLKEDKELAEPIYDCLVEDGAYLYDNLSEEKFKEKITKEYECVNEIYRGNIDLI